MATRIEWASAFLDEIGAPHTHSNEACMLAWMAFENTGCFFNPLATTLDEPGASDCNSIHVKNYKDLMQGIIASADTLRTGAASFGYIPILFALRAGNGQQAAQSVGASSWGSHPENLFSVIYSDQNTFNLNAAAAIPGSVTGEGFSVSQGVNAVVGAAGDVVGAVTNPLDALGHFFSILGSAATWKRIGLILGGLIIVFLGVGIINRDLFRKVGIA